MNASPRTNRQLIAATTALAVLLAVFSIPAALAVNPAGTLDPAIAVAIVAGQSSSTTSEGESPRGLDPAIAVAMGAHHRSLTASTSRSPERLDAAFARAIATHRDAIGGF